MALDLQLASLDFTGRDAALRGTLPATSSSPKEPSGALVGTSSSGANWLTVLSEPFNRYFLGKDIQRERENSSCNYKLKKELLIEMLQL